MRGFAIDPLPRWVFHAAGVRLERTIALPRRRATVIVRYANRGREPFTLEVSPLLALRNYHELGRRRELGASAAAVQMELADASREETDCWYFNSEYPEEFARGLDGQEDLWNPVRFRRELLPGEEAFFTATAAGAGGSPESLFFEALSQAQPRASFVDSRVAALEKSAEDFWVDIEGGGKTIIAGYHWFTDWGRDSMISLPGLTPDGDAERALLVLATFSRCRRHGLLPNQFTDRDGAPEFNSVDAPLWFVRMARRFTPAGGRAEQKILAAVFDILDAMRAGTDFGIRADSDGLLEQGASGLALTWMDARVGGRPITPRSGKAVEVNALWHSALLDAAELAESANEGRRAEDFRDFASRVRASFAATFWNEERSYFFDVVDATGRDGRIRPNALFAISLADGLVDRERARRAFETAQRLLLTPFGLRTLAPGEPEYSPRCEGNPAERDSAYHNGTVWPWLFGTFLDAHFRLAGSSPESRRQAREWISPLLDFAAGRGLGHLPEIFDAEPPHEARGCIAQAWSEAEILRCVHQYGLGLPIV